MPRLVLTRKLHERVRILVPAGAEREIWAEVIAVRCGQVRLAVEADAEVIVHRAELLEERPGER
jgi:carbon storage regulator CsrA